MDTIIFLTGFTGRKMEASLEQLVIVKKNMPNMLRVEYKEKGLVKAYLEMNLSFAENKEVKILINAHITKVYKHKKYRKKLQEELDQIIQSYHPKKMILSKNSYYEDKIKKTVKIESLIGKTFYYGYKSTPTKKEEKGNSSLYIPLKATIQRLDQKMRKIAIIEYFTKENQVLYEKDGILFCEIDWAFDIFNSILKRKLREVSQRLVDKTPEHLYFYVHGTSLYYYVGEIVKE